MMIIRKQIVHTPVTAMFIKAREARSCSCQSCGEQLVAFMNFCKKREKDIELLCQGRSVSTSGERARWPAAGRSLNFTSSVASLTFTEERVYYVSFATLFRYESRCETSLTGNS